MSNNIVIRGGSIVVIDEEGNSFEMNSGGIVEDFTSLAENGSGQKQELTGSSITGIGSQAIYVATESIACGQPLSIFNDGQGNIFAKLATTSSTVNDFLGISLNTASRGDNVTILTQGTTTVAFETSSGGGGLSPTASVGAPIYIAKDLIGLSETNYSSTTSSMGTVSAPNSNSSSIYANITF